MPFASVIVPVYNACPYLKTAIDNILGQSFRDFELILLNDGSTDDSWQIMQSYTDSRIKLVNSEANRGLVYQLNQGLSLCCGKYIIRMDADDTCESSRFKEQIDYMEANPHVGISGSYVKVFGKNNWDWKMPTHDAEIRFSLLWGATFAHNAVIMRRDIFVQNALLYRADAFPIEDYDMWIRLMEITQGANIPKFLTTYRIHGNQVSELLPVKTEKKLMQRSSDVFESYFFELNSSNLKYYQIFKGERRLKGNQVNEFCQFLKKVEDCNRSKIDNSTLQKNLDRVLLMRLVNLRSTRKMLAFLLQRRSWQRGKLLTRTILAKMNWVKQSR